MMNRERFRAPSQAYRGGASDAEAWVFVAFCAVGFVATVFFVFLSSHIGPAVTG